MTVPTLDRIRAAGADVRRIADAVVLVKIDDVPAERLWRHPAWPLCRGLAAVGFGGVHLRGAIDYFDGLTDLPRGTRITQEPGLWLPETAEHLAPEADIVVDATNDPASKDLCAKLSAARSSHYLSLTWGRAWVGMAYRSPAGVASTAAGGARPTAAEPLLPFARVAAGMALQEALILAGRVELASPPNALITHDAAAESASGTDGDDTSPDVQKDGAIVDVIGCGGIGVHFLEAFAPLLGRGQLRLFDPDVAGGENLPAQIAYADSDVGRPKVQAMAERLAARCNPLLVIRPFPSRYQDRPGDLTPPALRVCCPDNWATRKYVNDLALADGIALIDGGSSPLAAQVRIYNPGRTPCLEHQVPNLAAKAAQERAGDSCAMSPAPTLPGTNMICGGLMAWEALRALAPEHDKRPVAGTILYDARFPERFGKSGPRSPCVHGER
ncbi:MAG: ThiF family adenylyltransferase [Planctomycetes bacterium]|nr:ThiF family adenylyltransferase [Planctomycetota bacterium]